MMINLILNRNVEDQVEDIERVTLKAKCSQTLILFLTKTDCKLTPGGEWRESLRQSMTEKGQREKPRLTLRATELNF
jgi:hypothetical protein